MIDLAIRRLNRNVYPSRDGRQVFGADGAVLYSGVTAIYTFLFTAAGISVLSNYYRHIVSSESGAGGAAVGL